tara:strand:+ start:1462 stop:2040 length:579 start_codon:yes stop_codon:yes gene_type:complete
MDENMNILPPDRDIFHEAKKSVSIKQKEHLVRAREKAKQTIERRRRLEQEEKQKELDGNKDDDDEEDEEEDPVPPVVKKQSKRPTKKSTDLTEEEYDARKFEKFMKNMTAYERLKVQNIKDQEEAKKVKLSLNQDEYDHMIFLLEQEQKSKELQNASPIEPKQSEPQQEQVRRVVKNCVGSYNNQTSRFGGC